MVDVFIEDVLNMISQKAKAKKIDIVYDKQDVKSKLDFEWTNEALFNIIENAIKYTQEGGQIHIKASKCELFVKIDIIDNGIGIKESEQNKIFKRLYRSLDVSQSEGVGIGLYLSNEIINVQGGYIKVKSEGIGTTF